MTRGASDRAPRRRLSVLLLADDRLHHANTIRDHIGALRDLSRHRVHVFNPCDLRRARLLALNAFDVVVIHYSLLITEAHLLAPWFHERIRAFSGLKVQFIQDEYRRIAEITTAINRLSIDVIFTCAEQPQARSIYADRVPGAETITTLTGYLPDRLLRTAVPATAERPIEVGYRGRDVPFWLGELGQEKVRIAQAFQRHGSAHGIATNIRWREQDRIYGKAWDEFIASCRCMLGTESGASIADWDGSIERRVDQYLATRPDAPFEEVAHEILAPHEGNLRLQVISPRAFEAIALRTALIQFPGRYSGILRPWEHYIPLEKDFSNIELVVEKVRDVGFVRELVGRAHADIAQSGAYSYRAFVEEFDRVLSERHVWRLPKPVLPQVVLGASRADAARAALTLRAAHRLQGWKQSAASLSHVYVRATRLRVRIRSSHAWSALRKMARIVVLGRVSLRQPELRRLLLRASGDRELRERLGPGSGGLSDLLRLSVLIDSAARPRELGFHTEVVVGEGSALCFLSTSSSARHEAQAIDRAAVRELLADKAMDRVIWSHAAVGDTFSRRLLGPKQLSFNVGEAGVPAIYEFRALLDVARVNLELVADALAAAVPRDGTVVR